MVSTSLSILVETGSVHRAPRLLLISVTAVSKFLIADFNFAVFIIISYLSIFNISLQFLVSCLPERNNGSRCAIFNRATLHADSLAVCCADEMSGDD